LRASRSVTVADRYHREATDRPPVSTVTRPAHAAGQPRVSRTRPSCETRDALRNRGAARRTARGSVGGADGDSPTADGPGSAPGSELGDADGSAVADADGSAVADASGEGPGSGAPSTT
jgi:hypothetical protein